MTTMCQLYHLGNRMRENIRHDGDHPLGTNVLSRHHVHSERIVAGHDREPITSKQPRPGHAFQASRGLFHACELICFSR